METYYNLIATLEFNLKALETNSNNLHTLSEQSISYCKLTLQQLRACREKHPFEDKQSEIEFYKHIKPKVLSYLIFYIKRLHIESKRPKEGTKEEIRHLKKYIAEFQNYFYNNLEFYHYYKSGSTNLDEQYFLNINKTIRLNLEAFHFFTDEQFSSSHDTSVATIMAFTRLIEYLKNEIHQLENPHHQMPSINPYQNESQLNWTGSYREFVELTYALYTSGRINNGNLDIKVLALSMQNLFNLKNNDFYHTFGELKGRKINRTKFLDTLKESLIKYMDNQDDILKN
ncbi:RteC protein [Flavobacteriaceae bacterium MAR_2010_105]|nr:RteC protein [Flavobacteriaceae bacterium MAR_2010_105]